jgi:hypothetical protein
VPISLRAAALRTALERVLDEPAHTLAVERGIRIHAPAPADQDARWGRLLTFLRTADRWGSNDTTGCPEIWAEIHDEVSV